jgi:tetratricopeptide (TPR) repeat protein
MSPFILKTDVRWYDESGTGGHMSQTEDARSRIIAKYLNEYKYMYKDNEINDFFNKLAEESRESGLKDLELFAEGYQLAIKKEFESAIDRFYQSLAINGDNAYPWNGLGIVYSEQKEYDKAKNAYFKAIELDEKFTYPWIGLGNVYSKQKEYDKAKDAYFKAIELDEKFASPWNDLGNVYSEQKEYDKAKNAYFKAIELDEKFTYPWIGLGNDYSEQKEYDKAKNAYFKAIELDEKFTYPWNGLGNVYSEQKEYDKAKDAYFKAIELDEKFTYPWNGLGNVYSKQKEYDKAKDTYQKAIKLDENEPIPYRNLGLLFLDVNDYRGARDYFAKAIELFRSEGDDYMVSVTENNLKSVIEKVTEENALMAAQDTEHAEDPLMCVLTETKPFEDEVYKNQKAFQAFVEKSVAKDEEIAYLKVLRRWNSYTPIVADNYHISKGGGYFLKFKGKGIVIDPGFNFIDNFKGAKHSFDEIDVVMITHAHNDHTSDLESILTLLNNYNKRQKGLDDYENEDTIRADIAKAKGCDIRSVTTDEIEKRFLEGSHRRKTLDIYVTKSVEKKFSGMFNLRSKEDYFCHIVEKGDVKSLLGNCLKVTVLGAKHDDIISDRDSVGFVFDFDHTVLVYTGDTGWHEEIETQYSQVRTEREGKHIVLLAHLGGFKEYESKYALDEKRTEAFYKNHLGRLGLARLIQVLKPKICFISEFGEELRRHREELAEIYGKAFNGDTLFFPADIGLEYNLHERKIKAITELDFEKNDCSQELTDPKHVKTCLLRKDYSLHYYDEKASFKVGDLIQVLIEKFDRSA